MPLPDLLKENLFVAPLETLKEIVSQEYFPKAINYNITIVLPNFSNQLKSGLILTENTLELSRINLPYGRIVSIGSTVGSGKGGALEEITKYKVGQWIQCRPHVGYESQYMNETFLTIKDEDVLQVYSDPRAITDVRFEKYKILGLENE